MRKIILPLAEKNKKKVSAIDTYAEVARYVPLPGHPVLHTDTS